MRAPGPFPGIESIAERLHMTGRTLRPRRVELDNVERLREIDFCEVVCSPAELEAALQRRLDVLSLAWTTSSS